MLHPSRGLRSYIHRMAWFWTLSIAFFCVSRMRIPYGCTILEAGSNEAEVCCPLQGWWTAFKVPLEEAKFLVRLADSFPDVVREVEGAVDDDSEICGYIDVLANPVIDLVEFSEGRCWVGNSHDVAFRGVAPWCIMHYDDTSPSSSRGQDKILSWYIMDRYKILGRWLEILVSQEQSLPGGSDRKCWADMSQIERD